MTKIDKRQTPFYLRYGCTYRLRHKETTEKVIRFGRNLGRSEVLTNQGAAREFLQKKDEIRLDYD